MLLPNDISKASISKVCESFVTPTSEIIIRIAAEQRLFMKRDDRVQTKKLKTNLSNPEEFGSEAKKTANIANRK